jgi:hypothetical protein
MEARFMRLVEDCRREIGELDDLLASGAPLKTCWDTFRATRETCLSLFREALAFMQGASLRQARLDGGYCDLADALLDELDSTGDLKWGRMTIPAESEFFGDMAQIIRLRFPEVDIWNLPVAVHEFGHYVGPRIELTVTEDRRTRTRYPFQELLDREGDRGLKWWYFAHEQFADVFATYVAGPAYPCACVFARFDPGTAHDDRGPRHPSSAKRVELMLRTLRQMNGATTLTADYGGVLEQLREGWRDDLHAAEQPTELDPEATRELDRAFPELYRLVDDHLRVLRYGGMNRAEELKNALSVDRPPLTADTSIADVLNAAWLRRIDQWDEGPELVRDVGAAATMLSRRILEHRAAKRDNQAS